MSEKRIAMIAGSFDPVTKGHERMILRAAGMFEEVIVVICENSAKKYMFDLQMTKICFSDILPANIEK